MINTTANLSRFRAALRAVLMETKKPEAEIVNKALKDVAFRAASFTPKANPAEIRRKLTTGGILPAIAAKACNQKFGKRRWNRAQHQAMMKALLAKKSRGAGAIRAGWIPAITALGGKYRGAKLMPGGSASRGTASRATISRLSGMIRNAVITRNARGREFGGADIAIAVNALDKAIGFVSADRESYLARKRAIGRVLTKHSDK